MVRRCDVDTSRSDGANANVNTWATSQFDRDRYTHEDPYAHSYSNRHANRHPSTHVYPHRDQHARRYLDSRGLRYALYGLA